MNRLGPIYTIGLVSSLLLVVMCSAPDLNAPVIGTYSGNITIERNKAKVSMSNGLKLKAGDRIKVGDGQSRMELHFVTGAKIKCFVGTELIIGTSAQSINDISIINGECFYYCEEDTAIHDSVKISISSLKIIAVEAVFSIYYNQETKELISTVLSGNVNVIDEQKKLEAPACSRISKVESAEIQMQAPSASELEGLKAWVGGPLIEKTLAKTGCTLQALSSVSMPPQVISTPGEIAHPGELYKETIVAQDPEGFAVRYFLATGPDGLTVDSLAGRIRYKPDGEGDKNVKILIIDQDSNIVEYQYTLMVTVKPTLSLLIPSTIKPGEPVDITARTKKSRSDKGKVDYRFDINGDGAFDFPSGGDFGSKSTVPNVVFSKDGITTIKAEARIGNDILLSATKKIIVNTPPAVLLKISPEFIRIDESVTIDASGSTDPKEQSSDLKMRFDINGDGVWDIPSNSKFTKEQTLVFKFDSPGKKKIKVQVCDGEGACSIASSEIFVGRGLTIKDIDCVDTAHVGDTISLSCIPEEPEFSITGYTWSVKGPQEIVIKENKQRVNASFGKEGEYVLTCTIIDEKNQSASLQKSIIIVNATASVSAGGPYTTSVNSPITVKGNASDKDSRITKYSWDFNDDGKADTESVESSSAVWIFKHAGTKKIKLTVSTADGKTFSDDAEMVVINSPPVADAGKDRISRSGRKVKLNGCAVDSEKNICEYAWDFDADGTYDWKSSDTGFVEHEFKEYSVAVFKVIDSDSAYSIDSVKVIVCQDGMETVENGRFCIDTYEWPNQKNVTPQLDVSYEEAMQICKDAGKRLCTSQEWEIACRSDEKKWKYPYGKNYVLDKCNNLGNGFSKNKPSESGYFSECVGSAGVFDMSGNAAEWVSSDGGKPVAYGGSWQNGAERSMCNSMVQLERGKKYFYVGFRCCK
jgi:PKD repeat protein